MAKRWPDEQEADMTRGGWVRRPNSLKPETCTDAGYVYPTGISVKVGAQYPGRSVRVLGRPGYRRRKTTGCANRSHTWTPPFC